MDPIIENHKEKFEQAVKHLTDELTTLRVGRANPAMIENILVEAYGTKTPIQQLASIAVPEARTMTVQPWDKTVIKDIEKAITQANIGITPVNEGEQIRLTVPQMTEEARREITKTVGEKEEQARITVRQQRDKVKEEIVKMEREKEITEDDRYDLLKQLDEFTKDYNNQIKEIGERKIKEIMTI